MNLKQAEQLAQEGLEKAIVLTDILIETPKETPLYNEMKEGVLESLSWVFDDEIIDAMYDADMEEMRRYGEEY